MRGINVKSCQTTGVATLTVLEFAMWGTDLTCLFVNMSNSYKQNSAEQQLLQTITPTLGVHMRQDSSCD